MNYTCMSFNILGIDEAGTDIYSPSEIRAEYIAGFLDRQRTDIVGIQEAGSHHGLYDWINNFGEKIRKRGFYSIAAMGDEEEYTNTTHTFPDKKVSLSAGLMILYNKEKFELIERGAHRYSSDESQERYFQWVHLKDKNCGKDVFVTNTHWSINFNKYGKVSEEAGAEHRTKQANELREFWETKVGNNILFATGDYNCRQDSDWIKLAEQGIYKQVETASNKDFEIGDHIDNIFVNPELVTIEDLHFSKERMDVSAIKSQTSPLYLCYPYGNLIVGRQTSRMSDHDPLLVTVSIK